MPLTIARSSGQVGRLIQRFRLEQGLTQTQLAQLAGQRQEMISKIETGQGGVKLSTLFDVLAALGLEMTLEPRSQSSTADIEDIF
ncbi:helix-turn-helix transcriptional regulator [Phenylobacterium sp.]|jgi:HTH-type transcriptional regulator/antitoxin HipB|uniref:helix-turn-helix domain-containing protein n=1 Tax=Phenylobacterium sp. TaxID=1871053 RepID=UPI000C933A41|nr:helix-turn-helix transcriptional regulator [Phenylobacterium sp.]MAK80960.1 transcriptional regulator [Phenylobacterium sp.]MBW0152716.1 helix-turn-helix domain-containing protein [Phenylobacterium sp.]|tara:strand:+ start:26730 stop:26984 length:255 start_codon:yes stop_codon:yes gene_type:complete